MSEIDVSSFSSGDKIPFDPTKSVQIQHDGHPPTDIQQGPEGFTVTWDDGFFIVLTPESGALGEGEMPKQVSINTALFGQASDDTSALPDYLQWVATYSDNPLPFAPLPPYAVTLPEAVRHDANLIPIETTSPPTTPEPIVLAAPVIGVAPSIPNQAPIAAPGSAQVSEEGLPGGLPDSVPTGADTTNAASFSGKIAISDPNNDPLTVTLHAPADPLFSNGQPITWAGNGTHLLVGTAGAGQTIVTIAIDNAGHYTVTLQGPLDHPFVGVEDALSFNVGVTVSDGLLSTPTMLTVTVEDDSPSIIPALEVAADPLVVDESNLAINATASFADNFTSAFGADGAGSIGYALGIRAGGTGLVDTASNQAVVLGVNAGVVEGRTATGGDLVFTLSVDASGNVSLDQLRAVVHSPNTGPDQSTGLAAADLITLTATITDKDGDPASATLNLGGAIAFHDDAPSAANVVAPQVLDEEGLSAGILGGTGDVAGATITTTGSLGYSAGADQLGNIALSGPSILGNEAVTSNWNSLTNTLTISSVRGNLMTVALTDLLTGAYAVTLLQPLMHPVSGTEDNITLNVGYTIADKDGDSAAGSLQITVNDDSPIGYSPAASSLTNIAGASISGALLDADGNLDNNVGADQPGSIQFTGITNGQLFTAGSTSYTSGGQDIRLFESADGHTLIGRTGAADGSGPAVFQVTLHPDGSLAAATDSYDVQLFAKIDNGERTVVSLTDLGFASAGNKAFNYIDVAGTTQDMLFSGYNRSTANAITIGSVNTNSTAIGVNNQSMNDGENLRIDFVNSPAVTGSASNTYDYPSPTGGHYNVNDFTFSLVQKGGGTGTDAIEVWLRAYNANDDNPTGALNTTANDFAALGNDPQIAISGITVNGLALNLALLQSDGFGGYLVKGLDLNDQIGTHTLAGFNRIEIENALSGTHGITDATLNGDSFDVGKLSFTTTTIISGQPVHLDFGTQLTDADGDTSSGHINITLNPAALPIVLDMNGDGHLALVSLHDSQAHFDFNGDGVREATAWVGPHDGILVFDANGDHVANNAGEISFAHFSLAATSDLDGLRLAFDTNHDGVLDAKDAAFSMFGIWQDANGDGTTDAGEFHTLAEDGIASLQLVSDGHLYTAANGDAVVLGQTTFSHTDGSTGILGDVAFATSPETATASSTASIPMDEVLSPQNTLDDMLPAAPSTPTLTADSGVVNASADSSTNTSLAPAPAPGDAPQIASSDTTGSPAPAPAPEPVHDAPVASVPETVAPVEEVHHAIA